MIESTLTFGMRHRVLSAVVVVLLTLLAAGQLSKQRIDKSDEGLISERNPVPVD